MESMQVKTWPQTWVNKGKNGLAVIESPGLLKIQQLNSKVNALIL